jgi:predicted phosphodiesterase
MRIAVLGDIHGNLPALEAALAAVDGAKCDLILHTGDLVGYGPHPNETIDLVRAREIEGVRGHFDENAAWRTESSGAEGEEEAVALADASHAWTERALGERQRSFLKDLPFSIERRIGGRLASLFHASPSDLVTGIEETFSEELLLQYVEETGAGVFLFGHTHHAWHRVAGDAHFVNAGSVGCSTDGDPRASIAIVEIGARVEVDVRRVPYDIERTARDAWRSGSPRDREHSARGVFPRDRGRASRPRPTGPAPRLLGGGRRGASGS